MSEFQRGYAWMHPENGGLGPSLRGIMFQGVHDSRAEAHPLALRRCEHAVDMVADLLSQAVASPPGMADALLRKKLTSLN